MDKAKFTVGKKAKASKRARPAKVAASGGPDRLVQETYRSWLKVPDWKDPDAYPVPLAGEPLQPWGVEFLRRQDAFQKKLLDRLRRLSDEEMAQLQPRTLDKWTLPDSVLYDVIPELLYTRSWPRFSSGDEVSRGRNGFLHLTFNLAQPITEQLERAGDVLKRWQQGHIESGAVAPLKMRQREKRPELLPTYLRMLDAEAAGARPSEIADHLATERPDGVGVKQIGFWTKAARSYRDRGYVQLLGKVGEWTVDARIPEKYNE